MEYFAKLRRRMSEEELSDSQLTMNHQLWYFLFLRCCMLVVNLSSHSTLSRTFWMWIYMKSGAILLFIFFHYLFLLVDFH